MPSIKGGDQLSSERSASSIAYLVEGDIAVVSGAAQGNGEAIARGLAAAGAAILVADIDHDGAERLAAQQRALGHKAIACRLDVCDGESCRAAASVCEAELGPASILINNAGVIRRSPVDDPDFETHLDALLNVNVKGCALMVAAFLPQLRRTRGRIVNLGSIATYVAYRNVAGYAASKGAVGQLTKALAADLAADGIRVNGIAPGVIATPMTAATRADPTRIGAFLAHTPMGRVGEPDELVGPVLFLASSLSSYVTGAMLPVDGGYLAV